jgi:Na+/glutamate symporter
MLPFWQRLLLTLIAMLASSFIASLIWRSVLNFDMPAYLGGLVGGVVALPLWALLKRIRPKEKEAAEEELDR